MAFMLPVSRRAAASTSAAAKVALARPTAALPTASKRWASSSGHGHGHESDAEVYPAEGFNSSPWTWGIGAFLGYALYARLSPSDATPAEQVDNVLTRYITHNLTPQEGLWKERNLQHTRLSVEAAETKLLLTEAERPKKKNIRSTGMYTPSAWNNLVTGDELSESSE